MNIKNVIENYIPVNEQEQKDKEFILSQLSLYGDKLLDRASMPCHLTASSWIVSKDRTKVLMIYHKIYDSWSWLGGHVDGNANLLEVALKEAREESGLTNIKPVVLEPISIESLCVDGHIKKGEYVSSHLHLNVTYLLEADEYEALILNEKETKGVKWFSPKEALAASTEPWYVSRIYPKLIQKAKELG